MRQNKPLNVIQTAQKLKRLHQEIFVLLLLSELLDDSCYTRNVFNALFIRTPLFLTGVLTFFLQRSAE